MHLYNIQKKIIIISMQHVSGGFPSEKIVAFDEQKTKKKKFIVDKLSVWLRF